MKSVEYQFQEDHRSLVAGLASNGEVQGLDSSFDAVILLNHRHPDRLGFGSDLAASLGSSLLAMCSAPNQEAVAAALGRRRRRAAQMMVLALDWPAAMPLAGLLSPREDGAQRPKYRDVAAKRNMGLALARSLGWRRVLFLDDDVRDLTPANARRVAGALGTAGVRVVSCRLRSFPDNSVVCHARRLAGMKQEVFIGSGAMAVDLSGPLPMFPPVYNEDWLFFFDLMGDRAVRQGGDVRQLEFNPFELVERASDEEFGDLLGEGLLQLQHGGASIATAMSDLYWERVVWARRCMIQQVRRELAVGARPVQRPTATSRRVEQALASLDAAAAEHSAVDLAPSLASFVRAWRADIEVWNDWFEKLERVDHLSDALEPLGVALDCLAVV